MGLFVLMSRVLELPLGFGIHDSIAAAAAVGAVVEDDDGVA